MRYQNQLSRIRVKLDQLRSLDTSFGIGQASVHRYELNPPAPNATVTELEKIHKVSLPDDYRLFVTAFGNGGAGPDYGLFTIEESFADHLHPGLPFPYESAMRVPYSDDQTEEDVKQLGAFFADSCNNYGKLVIGEMGCGIMIDLVVNGPSKGQVWIDDRTYEWGGLYPYDQFDTTQPLRFLDWYEMWLDQALSHFDRLG